MPAAGRGSGWLSYEWLPVRVFAAGGSKEERAQPNMKQECLRGPPSIESRRNTFMSVILGVDPHKATHTAVAIDRSESEVARARV